MSFGPNGIGISREELIPGIEAPQIQPSEMQEG